MVSFYRGLFLFSVIIVASPIYSDEPTYIEEISDSIATYELDDFEIVKRRGTFNIAGPETGFIIGRQELMRAACCNLGESFTTNPSVDVAYADPATGARQIKLLGLSGTYVQMMAENIPAFRGAAMPYALRYVPGPWMKSISVSKGAATVKNGYESITGQINIEYLKPQDDDGVTFNVYIDSETRTELNAEANFHISPTLSTGIFAHAENRFISHDTDNDGFIESPLLKQINVQNRWFLNSGKYIFHGGISFLAERSRSGQTGHIHSEHGENPPYLINLDTRHGDVYMKHAYIINTEHSSNVALVANATIYRMESLYGIRTYNINQKNLYAQLMYETKFSEAHSISVGASFTSDWMSQHLLIPYTGMPDGNFHESEIVPGIYAQYTFQLHSMLTAMAGIRYDHSSVYGSFITPRFNIKYNPFQDLTLKTSIGKGYRTVHPWAEYNYLLASGRTVISETLNQESAWNYGIAAQYKVPLRYGSLHLNAEYFYTDFLRQAIVDYETDATVISISNLHGKSFSHTFQVDAMWEAPFGLSITAAWRLNDVRTTYNGILMEKPLTSRYKGLLSASYSTELKLWQFDLTLALNGGGRMPMPYELPDGSMSWNSRFPTFPSLNFQITRWFRHFSIYIGGENLTSFRQKNPVVWASDPWNQSFDPTIVWGPLHGAMAYIGIRFNFGKI